MIRRLLTLAACAMLAACGDPTDKITSAGDIPAATAAPGSAVAVVADKVTIEGVRGFNLASNTYQAAGAALVPLIRARVLSAATVDRIEALNLKVRALREGADRTLTLAQRTAGIMAAAEELFALKGGR